MRSAPDQHFHEEDAEQLLGALAGIVSAHIVTDASGQMVEIHVLSTPELHPKQVVRNVESALSAGLGIQVDRRIVSVAQIRTESGARRSATESTSDDAVPGGGSWVEAETEAAASSAPQVSSEPAGSRSARADGRPSDSASAGGAGRAGEVAGEVAGGRGDGVRGRAAASGAPRLGSPGAADPAAESRLQYVRYEARRSEDRCTCQVVLRGERGEVTGTGEGPDTTVGRAEAAARAVFDGIGRARPELRLKLETAVISSSRGRSFVIVSAHTLQDRTTTPLAGAAALNRSPEEAAILAALQASNRWSG